MHLFILFLIIYSQHIRKCRRFVTILQYNEIHYLLILTLILPSPNQGSKIWVPTFFTLLTVIIVLLGRNVTCMPSA
jgi:cell division protein FtsW (lipid II flippase)